MSQRPKIPSSTGNVQLQRVLKRIAALRTYKRGERRAPHKPLLLLVAIGEMLRGNDELKFRDVESALMPLLTAFAPPVQGRHQPELPYWYLISDGLWAIDGSDELPRQAGGFPRMAALRRTSGHLAPEIAALVKHDLGCTDLIVEQLLDEYFPRTLHEDILAAVGIEMAEDSLLRDTLPVPSSGRSRDPRFRESVLRAYEHQCAATGFRAALGGAYFGCEAAHVRWHAYDGPDDVSNGIALEPTMHKLLDAGAWTMTDERRILVSSEFTGSQQALKLLRDLHGQPIRNPLPGTPLVSIEFIKWHREPRQGGVFRPPALPL